VLGKCSVKVQNAENNHKTRKIKTQKFHLKKKKTDEGTKRKLPKLQNAEATTKKKKKKKAKAPWHSDPQSLG
jgi:hypothetical protein